MKQIILVYICLLLGAAGHLYAQSLEKNIEQRLTDYFTNYQTSYAHIGKCKLDHFTVDHEHKTLQVYANDNFGYQPFTEENTQARSIIIKLLFMPTVSPLRIWFPTSCVKREKTRVACTVK